MRHLNGTTQEIRQRGWELEQGAQEGHKEVEEQEVVGVQHVNQVHTTPRNVGEDVGRAANLGTPPIFVGKIQEMENLKELEELPKLYRLPILQLCHHHLNQHLKK